MKTYTGGCHCGKVRFEFESDLSKSIECNCSHCAIKGLILTFVPATQFTLLAGEDSLTEYRFNKKHIAHLFCRECGVQSFGRGQTKDGTPTCAINMRCVDGVDVSKLDIVPVDGKSY